MALINSYYPLLDLDIAQRGTISTSRHYLEISAQAPKTYEEFVKRAKDLNVNRLKFCDNAEDTDMYLDVPWPSWAK